MRLKSAFNSVTVWMAILVELWLISLPLTALAVKFRPPSRGIPGRREGGGTRDPVSCVQGALQLMAIVPQSNLGLTTSAYPRFFWYMPKTSAKYASFELIEADDRLLSQVTATEPELADKTPIYTTSFRTANTPGVASLSLPNNATIPPLVVGKTYRWVLKLNCSPNNPNRDVTVTGWVQRVEPEASLASQLSAASERDRLPLYADNGLWYDTLATLAELRCTNPQDTSLVASWSELMQSVKLDNIASQSLLQQCQK